MTSAFSRLLLTTKFPRFSLHRSLDGTRDRPMQALPISCSCSAPGLVPPFRWTQDTAAEEQPVNAATAKEWSASGGAGGEIEGAVAQPTDNADAPGVEYDEDGNMQLIVKDKCRYPAAWTAPAVSRSPRR